VEAFHIRHVLSLLPVYTHQPTNMLTVTYLTLRREAQFYYTDGKLGVILTPRILWCILLVLSRVLNAIQLISPRKTAISIILLHPRGGIAIRHVCLFVRLCVRKHVLGRNILKTVGDS